MLKISTIVQLPKILAKAGLNPKSGNWLRGAIVGHGDIAMPQVLRAVKESGYDDYISIEFEGLGRLPPWNETRL
jgi:sugar phosphate isomerase/epimerase